MTKTQNEHRPQIEAEQFGFVGENGKVIALFSFRVLTKRVPEVQKDEFTCLVDYDKTIHKIRHEKIFEILKDLERDEEILRLIKNLY